MGFAVKTSKRKIKCIFKLTFITLILGAYLLYLEIAYRENRNAALMMHRVRCEKKLYAIAQALKTYMKYNGSIPLTEEHFIDIEKCLNYVNEHHGPMEMEDIGYYLSCADPIISPTAQLYASKRFKTTDLAILMDGIDDSQIILMDPPGVHLDGGGVIFSDLTSNFVKSSISDYKHLYKLYAFKNQRDYIINPLMKMKLSW